MSAVPVSRDRVPEPGTNDWRREWGGENASPNAACNTIVRLAGWHQKSRSNGDLKDIRTTVVPRLSFHYHVHRENLKRCTVLVGSGQALATPRDPITRHSHICQNIAASLVPSFNFPTPTSEPTVSLSSEHSLQSRKAPGRSGITS